MTRQRFRFRSDVLGRMTAAQRQSLIRLYTTVEVAARWEARDGRPTLARGHAAQCRDFLAAWCEPMGRTA
jgi:hypothetical protein